MTELQTHKGGCRCGQIRFEGRRKEVKTALCGCIDCQKAGGSFISVNVGFRLENFEITQGEDLLKSYADMGESGKPVHRFFCTNCGSPLFAKPESYPFVSVRAVALDEPPEVSPDFAIFVENIPDYITLPEDAIEAGKRVD